MVSDPHAPAPAEVSPAPVKPATPAEAPVGKEGAKKMATKSKKAAKKSSKKAAKKSTVKKAPSGQPRGKKTLEIKRLLERKSGVTRAEVLAATGWKAVSMQQMAKACGLKLRQEKEKGKRISYFGT